MPSGARPIRVQDLYRVVIFGVGLVGAAILLPELLTILLAVVVAILLAIPLSSSASWLRGKLGLPRVAPVVALRDPN